MCSERIVYYLVQFAQSGCLSKNHMAEVHFEVFKIWSFRGVLLPASTHNVIETLGATAHSFHSVALCYAPGYSLIIHTYVENDRQVVYLNYVQLTVSDHIMFLTLI